MTTDSNNDPFHELRLYYVASGRIHDMEARAERDLRGLFARHEVHPLAMWSVVTGAAVPLLAYLTPWQSMQQRSKSWAGFYADPEWTSARNRTNAGSELVESYEVLLLRALSEWQPFVTNDASISAAPVFELVIQSVAVGRTADVRNQLLERTLPALRANGAIVHGVFEIMSGRPSPSIVYITSWPSSEARFTAPDATRREPVGGKHEATALLGRADSYLMRAVPIDWV